MRKSDIPSVVSMSLYDPLVEVRSFGWGRVVAGEENGHYLLIVQQSGNPRHTLYEYDDPAEFDADVLRVTRFSSGGGSTTHGATVPATPSPPVRSAGAAEPLPDEPS